MTDEQSRAFEQLPSMRLVSPSVTGRRGALVRIDERLFVLSPSGLLNRWKQAS